MDRRRYEGEMKEGSGKEQEESELLKKAPHLLEKMIWEESVGEVIVGKIMGMMNKQRGSDGIDGEGSGWSKMERRKKNKWSRMKRK